MRLLAAVALLVPILLVACGDDSDSVTGPNDGSPADTHYEISVSMSSI